jgi:hypothetical protein
VSPAWNIRRTVETGANLADHFIPGLRVGGVNPESRDFLQNAAAVQTVALHAFLSAVEWAGLRPVREPMDSPPYSNIMRGTRFHPDSIQETFRSDSLRIVNTHVQYGY